MALFIKTKHVNISTPQDITDELDNICQSTGITKSQLHTILIIDGLKKYNKEAQTLSLLYRNQEADRAKIRSYYKYLKNNYNQ